MGARRETTTLTSVSGEDGWKRRTEGIKKKKKKKGWTRKEATPESGVPHTAENAHLPYHLPVRVFPALFFSPLFLCDVFRCSLALTAALSSDYDDPDYYDGEKKSTDYLAAGCSWTGRSRKSVPGEQITKLQHYCHRRLGIAA